MNRFHIARKNKSSDKKAILIGLNYPNTRFRLQGCHNDVRNMTSLLKRKYGITDIKSLIDKNISKEYNVLEALEG